MQFNLFLLGMAKNNNNYVIFQPVKTIRNGQCSRINTGAPLPPGADAVVMVEETELVESKQDVRRFSFVKALNNVYLHLHLGSSMHDIK